MQLNILDLPNEIFLQIFHRLNTVDVFYSFVGICERLDQLILDPFYITKLILTTKSFSNNILSVKTQIIDKICKNIIPQIHHHVTELIVEQHSMENILHAANYPQLNSLSLIDFEWKILLEFLTSKHFLILFIIENSIIIISKYNNLLFFFLYQKII
jgi:hypothetical protein